MTESESDPRPERPRPDAAQPDAAQPDAAQPDAAQSDAAQPDAAQPDAAQPDAAQPDAAQPDAAQPDAAQPDAAQSDETRPGVIQPGVIQPGVIQPGEIRPGEARSGGSQAGGDQSSGARGGETRGGETQGGGTRGGGARGGKARVSGTQAARAKKRLVLALTVTGGIVAALVGGVVLFANPGSVRILVSPEAAEETAALAVDGVGLAIGRRVYTPFGGVAVDVSAPGFVSERVTVDSDRVAFVKVTLREAPGRLTARSDPALADTRWHLDGSFEASAEGISVEIAPGTHTLVADHPFYRKATETVEIGRGEKREIVLTLAPVAGRLEIGSVPPGAEIWIGDERRGVSPGAYDLPGGAHEVVLRHPGYRETRETVRITNARPHLSRSYTLAREAASVSFRLDPPGGHLLLDGRRLATAERVRVDALVLHEAVYVKEGYLPRSVRFTLKPGEHAEKTLSLTAEVGEVEVRSKPQATVHVAGRPAGTTPVTLSLPALEQEISVSRKGYRTVTRKVVPTSRGARTVSVTLKTERQARLDEAPETYRLPSGIVMRRFLPSRTGGGRFTMGAPRGEKGRRANEFERKVKLSKPFYVSLHEVTVGQFAAFRSKGASAGSKGASAGASGPDRLPAVGVSWTDAARFCNWLSRKEGLQPFYRLEGGRLRGFDAHADGYRLPTEAEWEWLARRAGRRSQTRFVWGGAEVVPKGAGNLADESAKGRVPVYIPRYTDGFPGTAPVGSFPPDKAGLHDLSGNVSEWVHDWYALLPPRDGAVRTDPLGPSSGAAHVVKGSNWRSADWTQIRASFRDNAETGRDDLGFRIARYLYGGEDATDR